MSQVGCFSFYPGKNLGAYGEGGAMTTNDDAIATRVRILRDHAQSAKYRHEEVGFNYRMDGLQGAILDVKLRHLDAWNTARRQAAARYEVLLDDRSLALPCEAKVAARLAFVRRKHPHHDLCGSLTAAGIGSSHYPIPVHLQPAYATLAMVSAIFQSQSAWQGNV
jgi:dTDP-4-amino-4,6-dideoxygalactose transaminase